MAFHGEEEENVNKREGERIMRKMRRIKIMVLLFLVALGVNIKVKAAQATWEHSGDWMYYVENGYAVIGRYEGTETEVIIPEKL